MTDQYALDIAWSERLRRRAAQIEAAASKSDAEPGVPIPVQSRSIAAARRSTSRHRAARERE